MSVRKTKSMGGAGMALKGAALWAVLICGSFVVGLMISPLLNSANASHNSVAESASQTGGPAPNVPQQAAPAVSPRSELRTQRRAPSTTDSGVQITPAESPSGQSTGSAVQQAQPLDGTGNSPEQEYRARRSVIDRGIADQNADEGRSQQDGDSRSSALRTGATDTQDQDQVDASTRARRARANVDGADSGAPPRRRRHRDNGDTPQTPTTPDSGAVQKGDAIDN